MSRSYKKNPYVDTACSGRGSMKKWKKFVNSEVRTYLSGKDEGVGLNFHKKLVNPWTAPNDGKHYWDDPKAYRK